ncbi:MAG TPA: TrmH family RNA methyltransferase [Streptosporangiaceae bacterium]
MSTRNASFQQWQALLSNRSKRSRTGEFLVQGVRPISQAAQHGWTFRAVLHDGRAQPSAWARQLWESTDADRFIVAPELMQELGEKSEGTPELLAIVEMPPDDFGRIQADSDLLVAVFDRPANPGNVGTLIRSADAFGCSGLIVTGHAADPYDPRCIRASTGSIFSVPVVRSESHGEVLAWVEQQRQATGLEILLVGTDEQGQTELADVDLTAPLLLAIGKETTGLTAAWREHCDVLLRIPMRGSASSLNAATAGSILLYEAMKQRTAKG